MARINPRRVGAMAVLISAALYSSVDAQILLDPVSHPKFVNPLPIAARVDMTAGGFIEIEARQATQSLGLVDPVTLSPLMTTIWGYEGSYPGPTLVVRRDVPLDVRWTNALSVPHLLPVDQTLHWAMPDDYPACGIPIVTHVHGGHSESASDGLPDAWFTPGFAQTGPGWVKEVLHYDNDQEAGTVWYHDHALGITRLNVYAGLAGFYLTRDANEDMLVAANNLPTGPYEIEMAIQDRMFTADGQLYYPATPEMPGQPDPSHLPEFFGDFILVNSAAWPVLDVEPRQYRFRYLNGSDSRFYDLWVVEQFEAGQLPIKPKSPVPTVYQIGTDDGLLNAPVLRNHFVFGPGERLDMVFDFSNPDLWGKTFVLRNNARSPFPKGETVDPNTTGQIMAFRVIKPLDTSVYPETVLPANLRPLYGPVAMPVPNADPRELVLFEGEDEYGRLMAMLGTVADGALAWDAPITENPMVNDTEVWEIYNTTEDAHPIHLHLVAFRVVDRQKFKADVDDETGKPEDINLIGKPRLPTAEENGWKDTVIMYPGEVTRIVATFSREGLYVWHCHILSHEDHEMMRPYYVGPMAAEPAVLAEESSLRIESVHPNPFNPQVQLRFSLTAPGRVEAAIYDVQGRLVRVVADRSFDSGDHILNWDGSTDSGSEVASGVYFLKIRAGTAVQTRKLVMVH
jgi:spore coat protein A, manganese oxidase